MTPDQVITPSITTGGETNSPTITPLVTPVVEVKNENPGGKDKDFGVYQNNTNPNTTNTNTNKGIIEKLSMDITGAILGIIFFISIGLLFLVVAKINVWSDEKNPNYSNTVQKYKDYVNEVDMMIGYPGINTSKDSLISINSGNIDNIINSTIPFIFKKDILENTVGIVVSSILTKNRELQDINKDINKYGFIHPDIMSILETTKEQIPIMVSLHTLETIKFGTALKIFSMLDTFLQQAGQRLDISKDSLSDVMSLYTQRGEKDIANYLSMCYLNPYEQLPNCNLINDFNNYFIYEDKDSKIDTNLFANIFSLVESKLEKSDIASLQIDFNSFDPNQKNIGFRVTINTLAEDDIAFMARGIINPHIFIISTLVSLLKQSFFVIGDSINIDTLNIKQQNITIGNIQIPVNTSFMVFDLPLQNSSEREIFDFYDKN